MKREARCQCIRCVACAPAPFNAPRTPLFGLWIEFGGVEVRGGLSLPRNGPAHTGPPGSASGFTEGMQHLEGFGVCGARLPAVIPVAAAYLFGDVRPVADLAAVAVNGRHLTVKGLGDIHPGVGLVGCREASGVGPALEVVASFSDASRPIPTVYIHPNWMGVR